MLFYYIIVSDCRNNTVDEIFLSQRSVPVISVKPDLLEVIRGLLVDIDSSLNATNLKCAFEGKYLCVKESDSSCNNADSSKKVDDNLIKGVAGLAVYLGCCKTTAQNIVNKGILQKAGILYRSGARIRLRRDKLERCLVENPGALQ
ncbi:MAG: helix-turn-helix domain-containing protein [Bacteroidales bacterium]|nr:helix-turn-helix domain-containing protein [Bacteroidales bacterium]